MNDGKLSGPRSPLLLRSGDNVHVTVGDLQGMTGTVETWEFANSRYNRPENENHVRIYWVVLDGDSTPMPFLWHQLTRWDEMPEAPAVEQAAVA